MFADRLRVFGLCLLISGSAWANDYSDPNEAVKARQEQFEDIKAVFKQLRFNIIQKDFDAAQAGQQAKELHQLSQPLLEMFRVRSDISDSKALPRVWENWDRFAKQMDDFVELTAQTSESINQYANQEDARMFIEQAAKSCKSCHRLFKAR